MIVRMLSSLHLATHAPTRLLLAVLAGGAIIALLPHDIPIFLRSVAGWDGGAGFYIAIILLTLGRNDSPEFLKKMAGREDPSRWIIQALITVAAFASLIAIFTLLSGTKGLPPGEMQLHLVAGAVTILVSWSLVHLLFGVHYAHAYYGDANDAPDQYTALGGLKFPGDAEPEFSDFLYYSFVVGMTCQVSDVNVTSPAMRRLTLAHGVLAFFFNTIILAFSVNIGASLIS